MPNGWVPCRKSRVKIIRAVSRFTTIPPRMIRSFFRNLVEMKLSLAWKVSDLEGSSPSSEQNHPRGIRLKVYSVPDLSFRKVQILGGIPIQNSFTFTPVFFAARKCPSSWSTTRVMNIMIPMIIIIIVISFLYW